MGFLEAFLVPHDEVNRAVDELARALVKAAVEQSFQNADRPLAVKLTGVKVSNPSTLNAKGSFPA